MSWVHGEVTVAWISCRNSPPSDSIRVPSVRARLQIVYGSDVLDSLLLPSDITCPLEAMCANRVDIHAAKASGLRHFRASPRTGEARPLRDDNRPQGSARGLAGDAVEEGRGLVVARQRLELVLDLLALPPGLRSALCGRSSKLPPGEMGPAPWRSALSKDMLK